MKRPENSREKAAGKDGEKKGEEPRENAAQENGGKERRQAAAERGDEKKGNGGAALRLNRLKDQPGKAMIPAYGKRRVEKDW